MPKVLISDKLSESAVEIFKKNKIETIYNPGLSHENLLKEINNYDGLAIRSATKVTEEVFKNAENLKIISGNLKIQSKYFTAKIVEKSFMGDTMLYSIKLNQSENNNTYNISVSDIKNSPNPNIGDKISVTFEEDDVVAYYEE